MRIPDLWTIDLLFITTTILCSVLLFFVWKSNKEKLRGIVYWSLDMLFLSIGLLLIGLRDKIPDFFSIVVSNCIILCGFILLLYGLHQFYDLKFQIGRYIVLLCIEFTVLIYFSAIQNRIIERTVVISVILAIANFEGFYTCIFKVKNLKNVVDLGLGFTFLGFALNSLFHIVSYLIVKPGNRYFHEYTLFDTISILTYMLLVIILTFELILVINKNILLEYKNSQNQICDKNMELEKYIKQLSDTQNQLIQNEKLAGIGQLAAGIAHEINNPLGFVSSNFETLSHYINKYEKLSARFMESNEQMKTEMGALLAMPNDQKTLDNLNRLVMISEELEAFWKTGKFDYIQSDCKELMNDNTEGLNRIKKIVESLKIFAHSDKNEVSDFDVNLGLKSTLIVCRNELKNYVEVTEEFEKIPNIMANGGELNQVFLNIIINAVHAIRKKELKEKGILKIHTYSNEEKVFIEFQDNGSGIKEEELNRIFEPFFTTKPVGQGTGLGLSIAFDIIQKKHGGKLEVESEYGVGTKFRIELPIETYNSI